MSSTQPEKKILIVADIDDEKSVTSITFELLSAARRIATGISGIVCAAVPGNELKQPASEIAAYADTVYCVEDVALKSCQVDFYCHSLAQLCESIQPAVILMGHTAGALETAMKLSCRLGVQMITDCIGFNADPEGLHLGCKKPIYGDNAIATFKIEKSPRMATIRSMAMEPAEKMSSPGNLIAFRPDLSAVAATHEIIETVKGEDTGLDKADAVVAGGRGIKSVEDLSRLESLTGVLGKYFERIEMGASRPLIDAGWLPPFRQIGLTGEKIRPDLYIAIGISGSLQHMSGVFGARTIVAINNDPEAQIFHYADLGVVGDYNGVLPALIGGLKEIA